MMTPRENWLRALNFQRPEWIPSAVTLLPIVWHQHRENLEELVLQHKALFPEFRPGCVDFDRCDDFMMHHDIVYDNWHCGWRIEVPGAEGQVVEHPLEDWDALKSFQPPDPKRQHERGDRDWEQTKQAFAEAKAKGYPAVGNGERLFDRLYALRGFENLMIDIATDDPRLQELIAMLTQYELELVDLWLEADVDAIAFHTDIGTQRALMISPAKFRQHIKPMFSKIFQRVRQAGKPVLLSSDGRLLEIVDDLVECGVCMHDPQIRANTLEGIEKHYKGKMCINLDLDRQMFAFCSPQDIHDQIREAVERLNSPEGGLMFYAAVTDDQTPLENIEAIFTALEQHTGLPSC